MGSIKNTGNESALFPPRVKVCCIASIEEMRLAVHYGASAVGLVSAMPSGPGVIDEATIAEIASAVPPGVASFLLTCERETDAILAQQRRTGVNTIQLCDSVEPAARQALRKAIPSVKIVQVIHVTDESSIAEAIAAAETSDALLLDSGNPNLAVKQLGGTGRVHNWTLSEQIKQSAACPIYLAGGLNVANVAEAVRRVRPFGLDLCSSLRTDGKLDESKLAAFFAALHV